MEAIQGIWVASDDHDVVEEVKDLAPQYFPEVRLDNIIWISGGIDGVLEGKGIHTRTERQVGPWCWEYGAHV